MFMQGEKHKIPNKERESEFEVIFLVRGFQVDVMVLNRVQFKSKYGVRVTIKLFTKVLKS